MIFVLLPKKKCKMSFDRFMLFVTASSSCTKVNSILSVRPCCEEGQPQDACIPKCHAIVETLLKEIWGCLES